MKQLVWRARGAAAAGAHAQPLADVLDVLNRLVPVLVLLQGCLLRNLGRVRVLAFASKPLQEEAPRRRVGGVESAGIPQLRGRRARFFLHRLWRRGSSTQCLLESTQVALLPPAWELLRMNS